MKPPIIAELRVLAEQFRTTERGYAAIANTGLSSQAAQGSMAYGKRADLLERAARMIEAAAALCIPNPVHDDIPIMMHTLRAALTDPAKVATDAG